MRHLAFKRFFYIIFSVLLAAILPINCLAAELVNVSNSVTEIWNATGWNYFTYGGTSEPGQFVPGYYQYNFVGQNMDYNGIKVVGRRISSVPHGTTYIQLRIPLMLNDVESFSTDIYFGIFGIDDDKNFIRESSRPTVYRAFIYSTSDGQNVVPSNYLSTKAEYIFYSAATVGSGSVAQDAYFTMKKLNISSDNTSTTDIAYLWISFQLNMTWTQGVTYNFVAGMSQDLEIGTIDGGSSAIIGSLSGLQGTIDNMLSDMQANDGLILDSLGNVIYELESDAVTTADAQQLVNTSQSKGEQLKQLGNTLSSVPQPDIQEVTSVIKPSHSMSTANPQLVQSALSVVYSWDKFLAILALVIALGTISYILFGKK